MSGESDLLDRLLAERQAERERIGAELHNGLGQTLTAVGLHVRALEDVAGAAAVRAELAHIRALVERAMVELRSVSQGVAPETTPARRR